MFIYLIYSICVVSILLLIVYLVKGIQAKKKNITKEQISEKLLKGLKE